jgi:uncharacterized damage-inducible protein DinB
MKIDSHLLVTQLGYSRWASERVLDSLNALTEDELTTDLGSSHGGLLSTAVHIFQSDRIWLSRALGKPRTTQAETDEGWTVDRLKADWLEVWEGWRDWAKALDKIDGVLAYTNLSGEAHKLLYWQMVFHVVNHASYHRGQITTMLRQLGYTPVATDLHTFYLLGAPTAVSSYER